MYIHVYILQCVIFSGYVFLSHQSSPQTILKKTHYTHVLSTSGKQIVVSSGVIIFLR